MPMALIRTPLAPRKVVRLREAMKDHKFIIIQESPHLMLDALCNLASWNLWLVSLLMSQQCIVKSLTKKLWRCYIKAQILILILKNSNSCPAGQGQNYLVIIYMCNYPKETCPQNRVWMLYKH